MNHSTLFFSLASLLLVIVASTVILFNRGRRRKNQLDPNDYFNEQIYVGNLSYYLNESDLRGYFSRFGGIEAIKIIRNLRTGHSKGYAFVTYQSAKEASSALEAHGRDLGGRSLVVRLAKPRQQLPAY